MTVTQQSLEGKILQNRQQAAGVAKAADVIWARHRSQIAREIGKFNIDTVSGGRIVPIDGGIELPIMDDPATGGGRCYVRIIIHKNGYTVSRIRRLAFSDQEEGRVWGILDGDELAEWVVRAGWVQVFNEDEWWLSDENGWPLADADEIGRLTKEDR